MRCIYLAPYLLSRIWHFFFNLESRTFFYFTSRIFISHLAFLSLFWHFFYLASRTFISHLALFLSRISHFYLSSGIFFYLTYRIFISHYLASRMSLTGFRSHLSHLRFCEISLFLLSFKKLVVKYNCYHGVDAWEGVLFSVVLLQKNYITRITYR